ncbi:MAG: SBBP repeat-containing protein [Elusimicrobiota bacterium]
MKDMKTRTAAKQHPNEVSGVPKISLCSRRVYSALLSLRAIAKQSLLVILITGAPIISHAATVKSVQNGNWNINSTWDTGALPTATDVVLISHTVIYNQNSVSVTCSSITIENLGTLQFDGAISARTMIVAGDVNLQSGGSFLMPPNTGYISALKIKCDTAGQYGIIVNNGGTFDVQGNTTTTPSTRNCLIASDNPSAKTYIRNLSQTESNFNMYYVEVSSVGINASGKYGITFDGSGTRGKINYCSIHNGYYGIWLNSSSNNTISNNSCYSNSWAGIYLYSSSNNTISNNNCYSNSADGILLDSSANNNTITNNNCYSNASGILVNNSSNTTLSNNSCYSNYDGIFLNASSNNTISNNSYYSNTNHGIRTQNSINNTVVNCDLSSGGNNTNGDIGYDSGGYVSKLTLKNCKLYSTTKVDTTGMDTAGSYLVSYNQDGTSGTTKVWGDYHIGQAEGLPLQKFNYAEPLYVSTATLPNSTKSGIGTITYPVTIDSMTVTELWEVKCTDAGLGYFSVKRGTFTPLTADGTATAQVPYSSTARGVGFTLLTTNFVIDDAFYFVTISSSVDMNVQKRIEFNDSPIGTKLTVDNGGTVQMLGTAANPTISTNAVGSTYYGFQSSGTLNLSNYVFSNLLRTGLEIYPQANVVDLSSGTFNTIQGSADSSYIRVNGLTSNKIFYGCAFNDTSGTANYNVKSDGAGINWTFRNWSGVKGGAAYTSTLNSAVINWEVPPAAPTNLNATLLSPTSIQWQFTDNATNETGLYISSGTSTTMRLSPNLGNGSYTGTTSWVETTLTPNTAYQRYAEAVNVIGSSWSVSITSYTLANKSSGTYISNVTSHSITANWYANGNPNGTYFDVEYSTADNFVPYGEVYGTVALTADCTGLFSNTTYYFRTNARNFQSINTGFDTVVSTKTLPPPDIILPVSMITFPSVSVVNTLATISGTSADNVNVSGVSIKIKRLSDDKYWDGAGFNSTPENWRSAYAQDGGFNSGNENWNLTETINSYLTSGTSYWLVSRASDTAGNFEPIGAGFTVMYDSAPPTVTDNQAGDDVVRASAGTTYNVDFFDAGNLDIIQYRVWTLPAQTGSIVKDWTNIATNVNVPSYTTDWQVDFNSLYNLSATNYISVRAWDVAGNTTTVNDVFYVKKDTAPPTSVITSPADGTNLSLLTISGTANDNYGLSQVEIKIKRLSDNQYWAGSNWGSETWLLASGVNPWGYYGLNDYSYLTAGASYWVVSRASDTMGNIETLAEQDVGSSTFTYKIKKTIGSGNWTNAATWFGGQTPLDGDAVIIKTGSVVSLTANTSSLYSLTVEDGAVLNGPQTINISSGSGGGLYNYGTLSNIAGTLYIGGGSGNKIYLSTDNAQCFSSMFINAGSTVTLQSGTTVGYLDIAAGGTLDANNRQIYLSGMWQQNGTFLAGASTVTFTGTNNQLIQGSATPKIFANFAVNSSSTVSPTGPLDINGNFTISGGTFVAGAYNHTISGDFKQTGGGFSAQTSTITFDGSGAQTVSLMPESAFNHFNYSGTGSLTPLSNLDITGNFTEGVGTFNCGNYGYKISGNMMNNTGWTLGGNSTFAFDGTLPQTIFNAINFDNVIVKNPTKVVYASDTLSQIKNLSIDPGCSFDSSALGYLEILGNFTSSGTFVHGGSFTRFGLSGNNTIWTVATSTFNNVIINKSVATDRVDALTNLSIGGTLEIYSGTLNMLKSSSNVEGATTIDGSYAKLDIGSSTTTLKGNVQVLNGGTLQLPNVSPAAVLKLGGALTVDSGGFFVSLSSFNKVTSLNPGVQFYSFDILAGTINVTGLTFEWVNVNGMKLGASAKIPALNNINFQSLQSGATALNLLYSVIPGTFTFTGHNFEYSPADTKNVAAPNLTGVIVVMQSAIGSKSGPSYETDPNDRVFWQPGDSISVVKPSGGETYVVSTSTPILWNTAGNIKNVKLEYSKDDFVSNINFIANVSTSSTFGSYNWTIPNDLSATVKVRVSALNYSAICGTSTANFAIQQPVAAPSGLTTALLGTTSIQWLFIDNASDETDLYISSGVDVTMRLSENLASLAGAGGTTSWWEINLASNTQYTRYSEARNAVGSSWSVAVASYTMSSAPFWTQIVSRSSYSVELDWHPNGNPEPGTDYLVSHSTFMDFSSEINGTASTSTYIVSTLDSGKTYYFKVRSRNGDGVINQQYDAILTTTTLDGVVPAVAITEPANGSYKNYASIFSAFYGPASDNVAVSSVVISMRISGGNYTSGPAFDSVSPLWFDCEVYPSSWAYQPTPSDILTSGTMYVMEVKAVDASGNWSSVATSSCTYDNTQPASVVVSPANNSIINSLTTLSGTASDNTGLQWVVLGIQRLSDGTYWTGAAWGSPTWLAATGTSAWNYTGFTTANLTSGTSYWVISRATDFAVNIETSTSGSVVFTYQAAVNGVFSGDFSQVGGALYDSTGDDGAQGVAVDTITAGGPYIYAVGASSNSFTGYDYFTVKYNSFGIIVASATYNGGSYDTAHGVAVDNSGNVYVTGKSNNGTNYNYFTIKYNSLLNVISSATYNGGSDDSASSIAVDNSGNVYVTGFVYNTNSDYFTIKYNSSLQVVSSVAYNGGGNDGASSIAVDNSGNVYVTGFVYNTNSDYFTIKYNSSLQVVSSATYNSGNDDQANGVVVDNSGNVYVTGYSLNGTNYNYFTIKYNSSLQVISSVTYNNVGDDFGADITVDSFGNVYVIGGSNNGANYDYLTIKYNNNLVFQSSAVFNGGSDDWGKGIAVDNNGYAYVTGYSGTGSNNDFRTIRYQLPDLPAVVITVPAAPTGLTATEVTNSSIKWVWTDVAGEQGYYLKTSTGGLVASVALNTVNYAETGLLPNTQYGRYVEAYSAGGSVTSSGLSKYTLAAIPTSFVVSAKDYNWIALSWSANNNPAPGTQYELYNSTDGLVYKLLIATASVSFTDTGLTQFSTYYYRLYAVNGEGLKTGPAEVIAATLNSISKGPISGKVTQSDGTAITGVSVHLYNNEGTIKLAETATKTDGTYIHDNLDDGIYRVICSWLVNEIESVVYKTDIPENSKNVLFTLEIQYQLAQLAGKITLGSKANFVSGKFAPAQQPYVELLQRGRVIAKIDADTSGNYTIPNLLPGKYVVRAFNGVQMSEPAEIKVKEGEKIMLNFRWALGLVHENVYAYPNPCKDSVIIRYKANTNHIVTLRIYNIAGELVRTIKGDGSEFGVSSVKKIPWNLENDDGSEVASGIYIYILELKETADDGEKATVRKKLAIIK